ncbi:hypothetical protein TNCV_4875921 [Trichonephila clavipes]|nr:hypothetical protein TNCV_4875921 [Trichonephila clavipes]
MNLLTVVEKTPIIKEREQLIDLNRVDVKTLNLSKHSSEILCYQFMQNTRYFSKHFNAMADPSSTKKISLLGVTSLLEHQQRSASLLDPTPTRASCSCSATLFDPEESNTVDRKMRDAFELTREW